MNDRLLRAYQVMATIVGLNLLIVMAGFIGKYATDAGSWWNRNQDAFLVIDQLHGFLFMVLIVLVARLTLREKWSWGYMLSVIVLACIPLVSFWSERRTTRRVHAGRQPATV
ncbi:MULTISPECIES: DUF3817 domain-containing protein [Aeromicrobium]|uniref:DUF3817 domain-containing protein n=1 Tax=Aeromicrobium phoceense TaxID=2754045 RepID=A0A838XKG8_9ACTN|nr:MULTISPECIES: DUF3817 domain-containing protein [Aeromicrobium]MBA4607453.1 DUF3817 domain-containing protein [Aeromicrobium phoceense]RYZ62767.1 MAG: DUF3817 domain-containing protein [Pseudomonadota bacterium]